MAPSRCNGCKGPMVAVRAHAQLGGLIGATWADVHLCLTDLLNAVLPQLPGLINEALARDEAAAAEAER